MSPPSGAQEVRAAGGVVVRTEPELAVVAVHRPRYGDWSLPKGKLDPGESFLEAALREVEEETGLRCRAEEELPPTRYRDSHGRMKRVRYWRMRVVGGDIRRRPPDTEVDEIRWLARNEAAALLSYDRDRKLAALALDRAG